APGLGHSFPAEWQKKAEAEYAKHAGPGKGRTEYPTKIRFVTYTLKYAECAWMEILGMERHYEKAVVDATKTDKGFEVKTQNVNTLRLTLADVATLRQDVKIDGEALTVRPSRTGTGGVAVHLEKVNGHWQGVLPQKLFVDHLRRPRKAHNLQGPIDDAF